MRLYPGVKYAIGPTIENGFYYDFAFPEPIAEADLARIEKEMAKVVSQNLPVERFELPADEALAVFGAGERRRAASASGLPTGLDQPFKVELIEDLLAAAEAEGGDGVPTISVYRQGDFVDLCRGPHLPSTNKLGSGTFKLTSLAGAYWRGDEKNADAHARLRHRLPEQGGAGRVPRSSRARAPARPPAHRPRPRPLQLPRGRSRLPVLPPQGHAPLERDGRLLARRARARRLRGDQHPA